MRLEKGGTVRDPEQERQRKILHEAFMAGWQAALAVKITSPVVLGVVESCFEMWLQEEVDERHVLGLPFRRRYDLPTPGQRSRRAPDGKAPHERSKVNAHRKPSQHELVQTRPALHFELPHQRTDNGVDRAVGPHEPRADSERPRMPSA